MKVTLATTAAAAGGVLRHMIDLAVGLQDSGHQVTLSAPAAASVVASRVRAAGITFVELEMKRHRADIWHLHLGDTFDTYATRLLCEARVRRWGSTVLTEHLPRTNASDPTLTADARTLGAAMTKTWLKRTQLALTDQLIVVSRGSERFMRTRYRLGERLINVVPNGTSVSVPYDSIHRSSKEFVVMSVGSLIRQKGHDVLIDAAVRSSGQWRVAILGEGPQRAALQRRIDRDGLPVRLLGWQDNVAAALAGCDAFCLPSRWEAWPYAALEAMLAARPIVASRVDGLDEIVVDGETGVLVPPDNPHALAVALDALANDVARARAMGSAGRERAVRLFGLESMVEATLDVYARSR